MRKALLFLFTVFISSFCYGQIYLNEVMSNNQNTVMDEDNDYSDWIEIYNAGTSSVNLQGYYLSDNSDSLQKWQILNIVLDEDSFITIWCSGKNDPNGTNIHTNFQIESGGETIYLSDAAGNIIDNISVPFLVADKSFGRFPDGSANVVYLSDPTYGTTNNSTTSVLGTITTVPEFDIPGGFFTNAQSISLSHPDPSVVIHYTLDGSDPVETSPVYSNPINVQSRVGEPNNYSTIRTCYNIHSYLPDWYPPAGEVFKCTVIRARAFKTGYFAGPIQTYSYFIDPAIFTRYGNLPVVSVVSDPKNLFNDTTGIYVPGINYQPQTYHGNYYQDWKRPANIEMYTPGGNSAFNSNFKIGINGQSSPSSPQKGLNVNASSDYGETKIEYPLFENTNGKAKYIQKFDKIKLRAWGSDRKKTLFRDAYCATVFSKTDLDYEAYQPVVLFIDGEYWGLQELRERNRNPEYYESHYYIDKDNPGVDILDGAGSKVIEGDSLHWINMIDFMANNPVSVPANYDYVKTQMDVNSYMLNFMSSIYFSRGDWPDQNESKWRPHTPDGKWKWIQWDMDNTTGYDLSPYFDMFDVVIHGTGSYGPSDLLIDLLTNNQFKYDFINLFADYMNTEFLPALAQARVDNMRDELLPYFPEYQSRWQLNYDYQTRTDTMKWWVAHRSQYVKQHIIDNFNLNGTVNLTLDVSDTMKGNIKVNTVFLDTGTARITAFTYPWTGQYFINVPVPLTATAKAGYRFIKWLPSNDTAQTIIVNLNSDTSFTALFDIDPNYNSFLPPVINEVMSANSSVVADNYGEFDDWLEIYNPDNDTLDIGGYYLTDNLVMPTRFKIAEGNDSTKIPPHGFLLIWIDADMEQGILHTGFKFNSNGDFIALVDPNGQSVIDSLSIEPLATNVSYGRSYDASPSLILFSPSTPNATNETFANKTILINELQTIDVSSIADNYNEFNPWIELYNPNSDTIDLAGWKITNDILNPNFYQFEHGNDSTKIAPFGFKLLWADSSINQGILHTDFLLNPIGCVTLDKPNNIVSDFSCYQSMNADQSFGRTTDGDPVWIVFDTPTPDSNNVDMSSQGIIGISNSSVLRAYPNPLHGNHVYFNKQISFTLSDETGRKLAFITQSNSFDFSHYDAGIYFLSSTNGEVIRIVRL